METDKKNTDKPSKATSNKPSSRTGSATGAAPVTRSRSSIENLVQVLPSRGKPQQPNVQDVPDPVSPTFSSSVEEVEKIQQVCQQENEKIRQQVKDISGQVSAMAQNNTQSNKIDTIEIVSAIRAEFDEKIKELKQAQPNIEGLVKELFTLRRDTNSLMEQNATQNREIIDQDQAQDAQKTVAEAKGQALVRAEGNTEVPDKATTRRVEHQTQAHSTTNTQQQRSKRMTVSLTTIRNRRYDSSSDSESAESDEDPYQAVHQPQTRTERQNVISFFGRKKGPEHEGQVAIKPADPIFDRLMNYRYYRLMDTNQIRYAEESKKLRDQVKTFQATFASTEFSAQDPIMVFDFLTRFVEEADTLGVSEAHAFLILPKVLKGRAESHLRSIRNGARSGGVTCWPEAVNHLLRTFATPAAIRNAVNDLRNIRQQPREDELTYSCRLNDAAHRCGNAP